jgi:hypothetical protein
MMLFTLCRREKKIWQIALSLKAILSEQAENTEESDAQHKMESVDPVLP